MAKVGKFCLAKRVKVEWLFQVLQNFIFGNTFKNIAIENQHIIKLIFAIPEVLPHTLTVTIQRNVLTGVCGNKSKDCYYNMPCTLIVLIGILLIVLLFRHCLRTKVIVCHFLCVMRKDTVITVCLYNLQVQSFLTPCLTEC